jgi:CDP-diacylglycerol--glycerol-3-phosphate 3-phosphatidyltransferase
MLDNQKARHIAANVVDPIAKALLKLKISANMVTFTASLAVTIIVISTWSFGNFGLGLALCVPFVAGDLLDGTMARISGTTSLWGGFLDSVMDRVTDAAMLAALAYWFSTQNNIQGLAASVLAVVTSGLIPYIRAKAESLGIACKVGIMERTERLLVVVSVVFLAAFGYLQFLEYGMYLLVVLNTVTVIQRMVAVYRSEDV